MYLALKLLHILSATVLFGTGLGTAFSMWRANSSADPRVIAVVTRNVALADWIFTTPAAIVQPLGPLYHRYFRIWFTLGWPAFLSVIAIFALMVFKPAI